MRFSAQIQVFSHKVQGHRGETEPMPRLRHIMPGALLAALLLSERMWISVQDNEPEVSGQ